jgi:hypothetical protein
MYAAGTALRPPCITSAIHHYTLYKSYSRTQQSQTYTAPLSNPLSTCRPGCFTARLLHIQFGQNDEDSWPTALPALLIESNIVNSSAHACAADFGRLLGVFDARQSRLCATAACDCIGGAISQLDVQLSICDLCPAPSPASVDKPGCLSTKLGADFLASCPDQIGVVLKFERVRSGYGACNCGD